MIFLKRIGYLFNGHENFIARLKSERQMANKDLHARLEVLSESITNAQNYLHDQRAWSDGHKLSSGELRARYKFLKSELDGEIGVMEAHDHHVSALGV
jgi:hypothetical protein